MKKVTSLHIQPLIAVSYSNQFRRTLLKVLKHACIRHFYPHLTLIILLYASCLVVKLSNHSLLLTICGSTIVLHDIDRGPKSQLKSSQENCDKSKICQVSVPTAASLSLYGTCSYQFSIDMLLPSYSNLS